MSISRRDALLGATAAAVVTGVTTAPLAIKSALAGVPGAVQGEDAHLGALHTAWLAAEARHDEANSIADDAMGVSVLFISSGPSTDLSPPAATRFSPGRRQGVFWKWRLDLSACHR